MTNKIDFVQAKTCNNHKKTCDCWVTLIWGWSRVGETNAITLTWEGQVSERT